MAVDPGTEQSAFVVWNGKEVYAHATVPNEVLLTQYIAGAANLTDILALERVESFGMAVGKETFATVFWSGRFAQAWTPKPFVELGRREVKLHLCGTSRATDSNIRMALLDRFGPVGTKSAKGLLYGLKGHEFAALAVAVTYWDQHSGEGK
jgi:hypothetical protein